MESNRESRIRKSSEFLIIKNSGQNIFVSSWLLLNYRKNEHGFLRFGVTVSRKVGNAVVRNKWKRWCRSYINDLLKVGFKVPIDVNFVFRPSAAQIRKESLSYNEFKKVLDKAFTKIQSNFKKVG